FMESFGPLATGGLRRLEFDGNGWVTADSVPGQPDAENWATGIGFVVDMQMGADGALYYASMFNTFFPRGIYRIVATTATGVHEAEAADARRTWGAPNPARASAGTTIHFGSVLAPEITMEIFDVRGRLVRTIVSPSRPGSIFWDGRTNDRRSAGPGVYFYRLEAGEASGVQGKVTLIR
ncbi:MAG: T9SS type A sorting domain-containing protein, partial [Gemmatimonadetes bacterium]|nr:T9SS type A sorting domain-containing protein [Gemmatimonadota bacterium]